MGLGDVKLFAMFGAFCGLKALLPILILSCALGTVVGLISIALQRIAQRRAPDPAVAPFEAGGEAIESLMRAKPLAGDERLAIMAALTRPGVVGRMRHHLPFGPSLAIGGMIVYLYGDVIERWFLNWVWRASL